MKKQILSFLLFICVGLSAQQNDQKMLPAPTDGSINYGDIFQRGLTNTTDRSITIEVLFNRPGYEHILSSKENFFNYLLTNNPLGKPMVTKQDSVILVLENLALINKSLLVHENSNLLTYQWESEKQNKLFYTPTVWNLSLRDAQCGHQTQQAARMLYALGLMDSTTMSSVSLADTSGSGHVVLDVMPDLDPIKYDGDPRQPSCMQVDATDVTGYMSCFDIHAHPEKLVDRYQYTDGFGNQFDSCPEVTLEHNAGYYYTVYFSSFKNLVKEIADVSGKITLVPGQSITWGFQVEELFVNISLLDAQQLLTMENLWIEAQSGDAVAIDSISRFIADMASQPFSLVRQAVVANKVTTDSIGRFYDEYYTQHVSGKPCKLGILETNIPAAPNAQTFGNGQSMSLPFIIDTMKSAGGPVIFLGDTIPFVTSGFACHMYDTSDFGAPGRHAPEVPDSLIQTFGLPGIISAGVSVHARMIFNPMIIDMFRGTRFGYSGTDSLTITTNIIKAGTVVPTAMPTLEQNVAITVFPNPVYDDYLFIASSVPVKDVEMYDVTGRMVIHDVGTKVKVDQLAPGVYVVVINGRYTRKAIIQ